jgi:hypothetical protein
MEPAAGVLLGTAVEHTLESLEASGALVSADGVGPCRGQRLRRRGRWVGRLI